MWIGDNNLTGNLWTFAPWSNLQHSLQHSTGYSTVVQYTNMPSPCHNHRKLNILKNLNFHTCNLFKHGHFWCRGSHIYIITMIDFRSLRLKQKGGQARCKSEWKVLTFKLGLSASTSGVGLEYTKESSWYDFDTDKTRRSIWKVGTWSCYLLLL